jgi:branched-chain amino acid transport system permease protein
MATVVVSGLFVGLLYGLLAIGLVIVYRASRIINFGYGETGMLAAFFYLDIRLGHQPLGISGDRGILLALPVAIVFGAVVGLLMERFIARPLRDSPTLNGMVGTIAAGLLFITFGVQRWGIEARVTRPLVKGAGVEIFGLIVSPSQILIGICALVILAALAAVYRFTPIGLRLRATALDPYAAALSGINVNATAMGAWAVAGALSAVSAVLIAPLVVANVFFMTLLASRAFVAALVGGLTSLWGALAAGVLLGIMESVVAFKSPIGGITDVVVALGILALLIARPRGLVHADY